MRAARALGGFKSTAELAGALPADAGLGDRTLRKLESGESELRPPAMREIAAACGLPYEFFTVDFSRLPELARPAGPPQTDPSVERRLRLVEDDFRHLAAQVAALVGEGLRRTGESQPASEDPPAEQPG